MEISLIPEDSHMRMSQALKDFESQFTYPLGQQTFSILHGYKGGSYFDFFKQLGRTYTILIKDNDIIVGLGVIVLREVIGKNSDTEKFWYLCDFKLMKRARGKYLLNRIHEMFTDAFTSSTSAFMAVSMNAPAKNKNATLLKRLFSSYEVIKTPLAFFEFSHEEYVNLITNIDELSNYSLLTTYGKKDIVIEGRIRTLRHMTHNTASMTYLMNTDRSVSHKDIFGSDVMFCTHDNELIQKLKLKNIFPDYFGTIIHSGINLNNFHFSSCEI